MRYVCSLELVDAHLVPAVDELIVHWRDLQEEWFAHERHVRVVVVALEAERTVGVLLRLERDVATERVDFHEERPSLLDFIEVGEGVELSHAVGCGVELGADVRQRVVRLGDVVDEVLRGQLRLAGLLHQNI